MRPSVILLREGTDTSQGKAQLISNIDACCAVGDVLKTTLGPRGMDKLVYSDSRAATISNDGASILKLLDVVHPAAKSLVDVAVSQDVEVGDGTTSVTLLSCELLKASKPFIEDNVHPMVVARGYRDALSKAMARLNSIQIPVDPANKRDMLVRCAGTALNSKLISGHKGFFSEMCVDAVSTLDESLDLDLVGIKKVTGGSVTESHLIKGVAFKKTFSYAGFEQQPKLLKNSKVLVLNVELELKSERDNAEVRVSDPEAYQAIVDAEWKIIYDKLEACVNTGAKIVLSKKAIGDLGTQYFADRDIFSAGRVPAADLNRVCRATGASTQSTTSDLNRENVLGECGLFEERQVGGERYNFFVDCKAAKTSTILLRGGSEQFVEEAERSLHDALMVVKRSFSASTSVVPGAGAVEMDLSATLHEYAKTIHGKRQLVVDAFAEALEIIPRQLTSNAGHDPIDVVNALRVSHNRSTGDSFSRFGVDVDSGGILDAYEAGIWEPSSNKRNAIASAVEAACLILSVDETVRNPRSEQAKLEGQRNAGGQPVSQAMGGGGMMGMGGGMPGVSAMKGRGGK